MRSIAWKKLTWCVFGVLLPLGAQAAGIQDQLNSMFGDMTNYTRPGVYEGQRRGVITGGSFVNRSRIMQENLIGFAPPSFSAGCAGMDFNGGSFSFINTDQFVQLLRAVAANAKGYAFQIALASMCPTCQTNIEELQKKIQQFNEMFSNSCQLAQGIVNDTASAFGKKGLTDASLRNTFSGFSDIFGSWTNTNSTGTAPAVSLQNTDPNWVASNMTGNLVWRQLINQGVNSWYAFNGDMSLLEAMMSITGTIVVQPLNTSSPDDYPLNYVPGGKISINDLIEGGTVTVWHCADSYDVNGCMNVQPQQIQLTGIRTMLQNMLFGTSTPTTIYNGVVWLYATNTGLIQPQQISLLSALPQGMGGMIRTLSMKDPTIAEDFINQMIPGLSFDIARTTLTSLVKTVEVSNMQSKHPRREEIDKKIRSAEQQLLVEFADYARSHTVDTTRIIEAYNALMKASEHPEYHLTRSKVPGY